LCHHDDEIRKLNTEVWIISFSTPDLAHVWIEETCTSFRILLDPERNVYAAYGMGRSWARTLSVITLWFYLKALFRGRRLHGKQGDLAQLGGDFIVDAEGIIRLAYPSRDAADRPPVARLLSVLRQLQPEEQS